MLMRLIYASQPTRPMARPDLEHLLRHARAHNARHDVTGLLLFDSHHFLQVMEGGRDVLSALYARLACDERHRALLLLAYEPVEQRRFNDWDMGFAAVDASHAAMYRRHCAAGRLAPRELTGASALALLEAFARQAPAEALAA